MSMSYLEQALENRFNKWGFREPLVGGKEDVDKYHKRIQGENLSKHAKAYHYFNLITGVYGLEFVAFSESKLSRPVKLPHDVILFPCFEDYIGKTMEEPLVRCHVHMESSGSYIYDGWLPIDSTSSHVVENRIEMLNESLDSFALISGGPFRWEPKYGATRNHKLIYLLEDDDLGTLEDFANSLGEISHEDRHAILRSVSWVARARTAYDDCSRFLFFVLAIESLCHYIENEASDSSLFRIFAATTLTRAERRKQQEVGIRNLIQDSFDKNPANAIREAYFQWVKPISKTLKEHLERVIGEEDEGLKLFFNGDTHAGSPSLYSIRHLIAHGGMSTIKERDLMKVTQNLHNIEQLTLRYLWNITNKSLNVFNRRSKMTVVQNYDFISSGLLSSRDMYKGPSEMAIYYINRI